MQARIQRIIFRGRGSGQVRNGTKHSRQTPEEDGLLRSSKNGKIFVRISLEGGVVGKDKVFPFLCIANQDNTADLLASITCQQHVWRDPDLAVGFILSGTMLDPAMSTIHIVFGLTDTASALSLAQFILNLSPHFTSVLACAKEHAKLNSGTRPLMIGDWTTCSRVVEWLRHVELIKPRENKSHHGASKNKANTKIRTPPYMSFAPGDRQYWQHTIMEALWMCVPHNQAEYEDQECH
ncbi:hypothetical protein DFH07DRAFT_768239 [Mycena maculata]|uniref:Uncharacterized protein n=1 Tax=Mycena maculata TaxID=230809 RepID=A0AAD7JSQ5_9AGAR|nr:hypothetical protein DFH07DRAFT_768239 [Mycena maculata]